MPGGKRNKRKRHRRAAATAELRKKGEDHDEEESSSSGHNDNSNRNKRRRKDTTEVSDAAAAAQQIISKVKNNKNKRKMTDNSKEERCIVFQDVMKDILLVKDDDDENGAGEYEEQVSLAFFELANSPYVGYRVIDDDDDDHSDTQEKEEESYKIKKSSSKSTPPPHHEDDNNKPTKRMKSACIDTCIVLKQDHTNACGNHTGGIVWETAYLLLQYILSTQTNLGKCLEVGAGCGLIGQVLASVKTDIISSTKIVMTEHPDVVPNLLHNVEQNQHHHHRIMERPKKQKKGKEKASSTSSSSSSVLSVCNLDWEQYQQDAEANPQQLGKQPAHSFDTILGTDVVFTPKLVEPLWETLQYMSHSKTNIYLCLQERCTASHQLLVEKAPIYNFNLVDITNQIDTIPSCRNWGTALECRLFHITQQAASATTGT